MIIGICDDEEIYLKKMESLCREYEEKTGKQCKIILFHSGKELLKNSEELDILFLDIQMKEMSGLDIQKLLWQRDGASCFVVYMTNYSEYAEQAYNANVIGFLNKPVTYDMAKRMLDKAEKNKRELQVVSEYKDKKIRMKDIVYLQAHSPYISFYLNTGENFRERGEMQEWEEKLREYGFYRVHHSYIVNMAYVLEFTKKQVKLYLGRDNLKQEPRSEQKSKSELKLESIAVARRKYSEFKKAYENYLEKRR